MAQKIYLAADHGGFELKDQIRDWLVQDNYDVVDLGTNSEDSVDYPEYGHKAGEAVVSDEGSLGIIVCGTGIGISIAANKIKGVRAALCHCAEYAKLTKEHNNANILALGGRFVDFETAKNIVTTFLSTPFEGGRHERRVNKIEP